MFPEIHPDLTRALAFLISAMLVVAPVALAYLLLVWYRTTRPRDLLFTALIVVSVLITLGGMYLGIIGYIRLTEHVVPPFALPEFSVINAIILLCPVVILAAVVRRLRS